MDLFIFGLIFFHLGFEFKSDQKTIESKIVWLFAVVHWKTKEKLKTVAIAVLSAPKTLNIVQFAW